MAPATSNVDLTQTRSTSNVIRSASRVPASAPRTHDASSRMGNGIVPGARLALGLLLAINLINYIDRYILAAVEDQIQRDFRIDRGETGLLATAFLVSYMCLAPVFGWLAGRYSRWMLVGIGVLLWSLASGATGLATGIGIMLATRVFVGVGEAAYGPVAPTIIADFYPIERRGQVLAWFYVAIPVGSALGYMLGGQVLHMGLTWHWAFFIVVPPGLVLGVWALLMREPLREDVAAARRRGAVVGGLPEQSAEVQPKPAKFHDYKQLLRIPSYVYNTAGMAAMTFAAGGLSFWIPRLPGVAKSACRFVGSCQRGAAKSGTHRCELDVWSDRCDRGLRGHAVRRLVGRQTPRPLARFVFLGFWLWNGARAALLFGGIFVPFPAAWVLIFIDLLRTVFQYGAVQYDSGKRHASFSSSRRLCPKHFYHPRSGRRHQSAAHRQDQHDFRSALEAVSHRSRRRDQLRQCN